MYDHCNFFSLDGFTYLPILLPFFPFSSIPSFVLSSATYNSIFFLFSRCLFSVCRCRRCRSRWFCFVRLHFDHSLMHFKALWKQADIHLNEFHCRKSGYYCFAYGSCCLLISIATVKKEVISLQCNHNEAKRLSKNSNFYWSATKQKKRAHTHRTRHK